MNSSIQNKIELKWEEVLKNPMRVLLFMMAIAIVWFNVLGYRELFNESTNVLGVTPFGLLIGFAEFAVLMWTGKVLEDFPMASPVLKASIIPVVLSFWFLCFIGVNSYLKSHAYVSSKQFEARESVVTIDKGAVAGLQAKIDKLDSNLRWLRESNQKDYEILNEIDAKRQLNNQEKDARRKSHKYCLQVEDCRNALQDYENRENSYQQQVSKLQHDIDERDATIKKHNGRRESYIQEIDLLNSAIIQNQKNSSEEKVGLSVKQQTYKDMVNAIFKFFGWAEPADPFSVFIGIVSAVIYPVYFLLNLLVSLNSEANVAIRQQKRERREVRVALKRQAAQKRFEEKLQQKAELQSEKDAQRQEQRRIDAGIKQEKRALRHRKALEKLQSNTSNFNKLFKYLRVWAHRRKKTLIVEKAVEVPFEVKRIVEVPVEKEVIVTQEKAVEVDRIVQVTKEVPVEVERIVEVEKEVLVHVDRIQKVPEPYFVPEPKIIIPEPQILDRFIPVPEGISADELKKLYKSMRPFDPKAEQASESSEQ